MVAHRPLNLLARKFYRAIDYKKTCQIHSCLFLLLIGHLRLPHVSKRSHESGAETMKSTKLICELVSTIFFLSIIDEPKKMKATDAAGPFTSHSGRSLHFQEVHTGVSPVC